MPPIKSKVMVNCFSLWLNPSLCGVSKVLLKHHKLDIFGLLVYYLLDNGGYLWIKILENMKFVFANM